MLQAGKPSRQREVEASVGTSDSKPATAFTELCNEKEVFKYFMKEEIVLDLPLYEGKANFNQQAQVQRRHRATCAHAV